MESSISLASNATMATTRTVMGCESDCTLPACGNGIQDPGEQCDDGNNVNADGCEADCTSPVCGNGIIDPGENCDDNNQITEKCPYGAASCAVCPSVIGVCGP